MLRSSILGKEFINYRINNDSLTRNKFSNSVRSKGIGYVPIVVDSVDPELSKALATKDDTFTRYIKYGFEIMIHMDLTVLDLIKEIKIELVKKDYEYRYLSIGLEDGTIPDVKMDLGTLYKKSRNKDDKILYVLLTQEKTVFGYIMSILKYLGENIKGLIWKENVNNLDNH
jgi:hypothetical protein